jgi:hypothetical protein
MFSSATATGDESANRLEPVLLSAGDVDEIYALYELNRSRLPYGFLANRTKQDYFELFAKPEDVIGTGIRADGRLIAYSICHRLTNNPYPIAPVLSLIDPGTSNVYHGDGTIVHPVYQGRMIARRITRLRWQQIRQRQIDHVLGLIAVDNFVSIGNALLGGLLLAGFARDETSLNYIAYAGRFCEGLPTGTEPITVGLNNHERQQQLFAEGHVVCDVPHLNHPISSAVRTTDDRQLAFVPWPAHCKKPSHALV